ncbi:MAG TPA: hypothetical protein VI564_04040 [Candidatus Nanoarchaeia archaeon]|nr:hypothetical protein [Candidatus Nanoarchaeia archaeon]
MIDNIAGIAALPVGILLFLNEYGLTNIQSIFGVDLLLIAAISIILIQVANILGAHVSGENIYLSYIIHFFLIFPSVIFFLSKFVSMPSNIISSLPMVFAAFILVEGLYSFFF